MAVLQPTAAEIVERGTACRALINELRALTRTIQGLYLNVGQDFDGRVSALISLEGSTIEWELSDAIPRIKHSLDSENAGNLFRSANYVHRHAPRRLNPSGSRWHEHVPVISRIVTIGERLAEVQV